MGRPRKEDVKVPVRRRMAQALWDAMAQMPYVDIRVMDLAERAGINHNMIYYYYKSVPEMALDALHTELADGALQNALLSLLLGEQTAETADLLSASRRKAKEGEHKTLPEKRKIAHLYAKTDADGLRAALRGEIRSAWLAEIGLREDQLSGEENAQLTFLLGGLLDVLAMPETEKTPANLAGLTAGAPGVYSRSLLEELLARTDRNPEETDPEAPAAAEPEKKQKPAPRNTAAKRPAKKKAETKTETETKAETKANAVTKAKAMTKKPIPEPPSPEEPEPEAEETSREMEVWML